MNAENLLETLRRRADDAPPSAGLLDAVRARSRRRRRHRQVTVLGAAVVAVALALTAPAVVRGTTDQPVPPAQPTQPAQPTEPDVTVDPSPNTLVPPTFEVADFPFTPGWAPPGTGEPFVYSVSQEHAFLAHEDADGRYAIHVAVQPDDPADWDEVVRDTEGETVTVRGQQGVLRLVGGEAWLTWQPRPDQWVTVKGETVADVTRYAEALVEEPFPNRPPFVLDLIPAGAELGSVQPDAMRFSHRDEEACAAYPEVDPLDPGPFPDEDLPPCLTGEFVVRLFEGGPGAEVPVNFFPQDPENPGEVPDPDREPTQVGEHEAEFIGDHNLHVFLDDGLALGVTALGELTLSREDMVRFAAGVQVTPDALPIFE
jgi:hypothetical protein